MSDPFFQGQPSAVLAECATLDCGIYGGAYPENASQPSIIEREGVLNRVPDGCGLDVASCVVEHIVFEELLFGGGEAAAEQAEKSASQALSKTGKIAGKTIPVVKAVGAPYLLDKTIRACANEAIDRGTCD